MSSLRVNKDNTEIWFSPNTPINQRNMLAEYFGFKVVSSFGKYLGTYIDGSYRRIDIAKEVINKLTRKLQGWKAILLSQARILTLCRTILQSLPLYQMSMLRFNKEQIHKMNSIIQNFFVG